MAIFRGNGGSVEGITESDTVVIAISQGGTGATTASGARSNLGLGTAATTNSTAYATAAQGAKADSALQSFTETDPVFSASEAASITSTDTTNWDTAYTDRLKWDGGSTGLNASTGRTSLGLATVASSGSYNDLSDKPTIPTNLDSLTDVVITTPSTNQVLQYNGTNWVNATGGGGSGTVTSVAMSVPTGLSVSGSPITSSGTLAVTYASGYSIPTTTKQTEWDTAYTDRLKWDGGSTGLTASTGRTSLGATTVGSNLFTLTNPSAVTFPRFNADNTVSSLTASDFRTAIGAGTGSGTVTSVNLTAGTGISVSGGPVTSSGSITVTNSAPMTYPSSGVAVSTGSAWNTPLSYGTTAAASSLVQLDAGGYANTNNTFGFKNRIINGAMVTSQRATSATVTAGTTVPTASTGYPCVDRFFVYSTGANVTAAQVSGSGATQNRLQITGAASVTAIGVGQRIEQANSYDLAGSTATLSVDLANSVLTTVTWTANYATTANTFGTIGTPTKTQIATGTFTVTSTVTNYNVQISIPSAATTGIEILFTVGAQTSGTWTIGNVQLEKGSTATSFDYRPYGTEFALCQRYYEAMSSYSGPDSSGGSVSRTTYFFKVTKRATPTVTLGSGSSGTVANTSVDLFQLGVAGATPSTGTGGSIAAEL